ncbi:hypothetical protein PIB30_035299 [Stylosanthes scabra]|uniref:Uncharacterized protein n=1 Tax=Stylosanthes scabra TaxID=79078 RepID=A0ABU6ZBH3_9FABA|nr:hypothetical protein [Stylosanthes scabra]
MKRIRPSSRLSEKEGTLDERQTHILYPKPLIHPVPKPPHQPAPQEEQPLQQPPHHEEQPSQQPHMEEEIINISLSSEDEHEPTPFIPLIPKAEEEQPHEEEHPEETNPLADEE